MKTTMFNAATALLLAAIACAAPLHIARDDSITITIKTGDGDAATTLSVNLDQLTPTSGQSSHEVAASIFSPGVFCQAFSDAAGTQPVGSVFTSSVGASFTASSSGDVGSQASNAVAIGSFLCSDSAAGVAPKTSTSSSSSSSSSSPPPSSSSSSSTTRTSGTVRVQLEQSADQFVQTEVPLDNSLVPTSGNRLGNMGIDLSLISVSNSRSSLAHVACQIFEDAAGTVPVGGLATAESDAVLAASPNLPSHIQAVRCGKLDRHGRV